MTNLELIIMLTSLDDDAEVMAWDGDANSYQVVTGCVYGTESKRGGRDTIILQTDDIS